MEKERLELNQELPPHTLPVGNGSIPNWLKGTLIRNGPSLFGTEEKKVWHWFDGLAMLHAFSFDNGTVAYTNRFLRTDAYHDLFDEGKINYAGFATDPCRSIFKRLYTAFFEDPLKLLPNADVNITKLCDAYAALTEIPLPVQFDPKTLDTLGVVNYEDALPKNNIWNSAHPHIDPQNNESINYYVEFGPRPHYVIYRIASNSLERHVIARIPVKNPSYMHSFSITENYVVLTEYPFTVNPWAPLLSSKGFIKNYRWHPEKGTRFTVVDRHTGKVIFHPIGGPFFAFHHVNAFERDGMIAIDIITYADAGIVTDLAPYGTGEGRKNFPKSRLVRYSIDLQTSSLSQKVLSELPFELPRVHPQYDGRPYRYAYAADLREATYQGEARALYKIDTETGKVWSWSETGCYPGEPIFAPAPTAFSEDDGLILALVLNLAGKNSFLLVLDAVSFSEVARVHIPHQVPMGLHGQFYTDSGSLGFSV